MLYLTSYRYFIMEHNIWIEVSSFIISTAKQKAKKHGFPTVNIHAVRYNSI